MAVVQPTLAVAALAAGGAAVAYLSLARTLMRRDASDPSMRQALRLFALWWGATGINIACAAALILAAAFGWTNGPLMMADAVVQRLLLAVALVGLMHYLLVLVRGRAPLRTLVAVYATYFLAVLGTLYASEPGGVYVGDWRVDVEPRRPDAVPAWATAALGAFLVLPPVGMSLAAVVLARRLGPGRAPQRNRITIVGLALAAWWVVAVVAGQREAFAQEFVQVFNRLLGLTMALAILAAYHPPAWLRPHVDGDPAPLTAPRA